MLPYERLLMDTEFLGVAYTRVPLNYEGPCELALEGRTRSQAVFACVADAHLAAKFSVDVHGGYAKAVVSPAPEKTPVWASFEDWMMAG